MNSNTDVLEAPVQEQILEEKPIASGLRQHGISMRPIRMRDLASATYDLECAWSIQRIGGTCSTTRSHVENSSVSVTIPAGTINTHEANRDTHLKSADFFETEKYPEITFNSTAWQHKNDDELLIKGESHHSWVTRQVVLTVERTPVMKDPWGGTRVGFTAKTKINRKDFGLHYNAALEAGGVVVGEEVKISLEAEFVKA